MTTLSPTDRLINHLSPRPRRKRASVPASRLRQMPDINALVAHDLPTGYYGRSDAGMYVECFLHFDWKFEIAADWLSTSTGGDSFSNVLFELSDENDTAVAISAGDLIAAIQASLSLRIKELADVLNVKRPTIYSWINDEAEPHASNRDRLQQVYQLAQEWNKRCDLPAERLIRVGDADGVSVVDLLKAPEIDEDAIIDRFDGLAQERMRLKAEADAKRPPIAEIAERHGFELSRESDQQAAIDVFTGKRFSPD